MVTRRSTRQKPGSAQEEDGATPEVELEDEEYEVEAILDKRGRRKPEYLVKWKGYDEPTWEAEEVLHKCGELLSDFLTASVGAPRPHGSGNRAAIHKHDQLQEQDGDSQRSNSDADEPTVVDRRDDRRSDEELATGNGTAKRLKRGHQHDNHANAPHAADAADRFEEKSDEEEMTVAKRLKHRHPHGDDGHQSDRGRRNHLNALLHADEETKEGPVEHAYEVDRDVDYDEGSVDYEYGDCGDDDYRDGSQYGENPIDSEKLVEVEELLAKRDGDRGPEYLVRWADGSETWACVQDLTQCEEEMAEYDERIEEKKSRGSRTTNKKQANNTINSQGKSPVRPTAKKVKEMKTTKKKGDKGISALERSYIGKLVAYSPQKDGWLKHKVYSVVGAAFIVGRVSDYVFSKKKGLYEVRWLDSVFQGQSEKVDIAVVRQGRFNYEQLSEHPEAPRWTTLCRADPSSAVRIEDADDLEEYDAYDAYLPSRSAVTSLADVERIASMRFVHGEQLPQPDDLYEHSDGTFKTRVKPQYKHIFEHSARSSFFAYLPISYWKQVLQQTNDEAQENIPGFSVPFTMAELMKFLGILWFMALVDKGEFTNYWGAQMEGAIFGGEGQGLDSVMPLRQFKRLRTAFCFRKGSDITPEDTTRDAAVRIRRLLNMLKQTGGRYVDVGRDLAVDEASVAARSKFARHIIMYNPRKPTGKYHFKFYMCCCATSWLALYFRLHAESTLQDRMEGVADEEAMREFDDETSLTSKTRQIVMEITREYYHTGRIVNSDNYYTSVQLLEALRIKGLYCRGIVKDKSKHFPRHVILAEPSTGEKDANKLKNKKKARPLADSAGVETQPPCVIPAGSKAKGEVKRGDYLQAVSKERKMLAASWCDGNIVTVISNADSSDLTTVTRLVKAKHIEVPAPTCIKESNQHMQGVDRNDQMRARFSVADGHSFKKWYKKLGLAVIDIARVNAYPTRRLCGSEEEQERDSHRQFLTELIQGMLSGKWQDAPSDEIMLFDEHDHVPRSTATSPARSSSRGSPRVVFGGQSPSSECSGVESAQLFAASRRKRICIICRFEGRKYTLITETCIQHKYLGKGLFTANGCVKRGSQLYKDKRAYEEMQARTGDDSGNEQDQNVQHILPFVDYVPTPPELAVTPAPSVEYLDGRMSDLTVGIRATARRKPCDIEIIESLTNIMVVRLSRGAGVPLRNKAGGIYVPWH